MKKMMWFLTAVLLIAGSGIGVAAETYDYLALVVDLKGAASVQRSGKPDLVSIHWGDYIYQGDRVTTAAESHLSLLFANGTLVSLGGNAEMTIDNHPGMQPDVATTVKNASQKVIPYMERLRIKNLPEQKYAITRAADGSRRLIPSIRALPDTVLTSPRLTAIATLSPFFNWAPVESNALYRITLSDADGVIWQRETSQTMLPCPSPLEWGKSYQWSVAVKEPLKPNPAVYSTNFQVIAEKDFPEFKNLERKIINLRGSSRSDEYYDLILGYTYLKYNLTELAVPLFEKIAATNPEAPFIHESLCRLYLEQNYSHAAQKEFALWTHLTASE